MTVFEQNNNQLFIKMTTYQSQREFTKYPWYQAHKYDFSMQACHKLSGYELSLVMHNFGPSYDWKFQDF